jgi:hypothetical protein
MNTTLQLRNESAIAISDNPVPGCNRLVDAVRDRFEDGAMYRAGKASDTVTFITKKHYGEMYGLKGAALNKAHREYLGQFRRATAQFIGGEVAAGNILLHGMTVNRKTGNGTLKIADAKVVAARDAKASRRGRKADKVTTAVDVARNSGLTDEQIVALLEGVKGSEVGK